MAAQCRRFSVTVALVVLLVPPTLEAQTLSDSSIYEALNNVLSWADMQGDDYTLIPEFGQWGLVFGWFGQGEEKDIAFSVDAGERYVIVGAGEENVIDLDLCVYDETGREVDCDTAIDYIPHVSFIAQSTGTWRATLIAYSLNSLTAYAGMALLSEY